MKASPEPVFEIVRQAIDLAIKCVDTGETLVPFITTEGKPGKIISIVADSADDSLAIAQRNIDELDPLTTSFAFAYDGYITMNEERLDAIYVEASYRASDQIFVFAQRYIPRIGDEPVSRSGNWIYLQQNQPRLKPSRTMRSSESPTAPDFCGSDAWDRASKADTTHADPHEL